MSQQGTNTTVYVKVAALRDETPSVRTYKLAALDGSDLPPFSAGSHIGIVMPGRMTRYYSICSDPSDRSQYEISVQREDAGRGGSLLVHRTLSVGRMMKIHTPRNLFPLADDGEHLLVAGGIGITPMLSMVAELARRGQKFHLIMCARNSQLLPFASEIDRLAQSGLATLFLTDTEQPDFDVLLSEKSAHKHLYICGSAGFMNAVERAASHWDRDYVHTESFTPVGAKDGDVAFVVEARASGKTFNVESDQSLLQAIRQNGIELDSVCENGTCGTCKVNYVEGVPDHRDLVLGEAEHKESIIACVSRAKTFLALDI